MKLVQDTQVKLVAPIDMKDGEIGIVRVSEYGHEGTIVQRFDDILISLGRGKGSSWSKICTYPITNMKIEILPKGTRLEI